MKKETIIFNSSGMDHTNLPSDTSRCNSTDQYDAFQSLNLARDAEYRGKNEAKISNESDAILRFSLLQLVTPQLVLLLSRIVRGNKYLITKLISEAE